MTVSAPVVNAGEKYINGLQIAYSTTTKLTIAAGQCRDSTNINDITLSAGVTLNTATVGANGIDTGSLGASKMYAVYAIGSSFNNADAASILSLDLSSPSLPTNYDMFRRLGYVLTDGSSHFLAFWQTGESADRWMYYDALISVKNAGSDATFTAVDCSACVPALATDILMNVSFTPNAAEDTMAMRPTGSSSTNGTTIISGVVAAKAQVLNQIVRCDAAASIDYKVAASGATTLLVSGYLDQLA